MPTDSELTNENARDGGGHVVEHRSIERGSGSKTLTNSMASERTWNRRLAIGLLLVVLVPIAGFYGLWFIGFFVSVCLQLVRKPAALLQIPTSAWFSFIFLAFLVATLTIAIVRLSR